MLDQLSPVAPARVRVVLLPIGQIKRARFLSFIARLQPENVVQLGDISPDGRPHRNMFSPLAFPTGMIVYDLTTFYPPPSHVALSPFELYREPLVIVAIADGAELDRKPYRTNVRRSLNGNGHPKPEHNLRELYQDLEEVRDRYPKGLVHQLLLFDYVHSTSAGTLPEGIVPVPPPAECRRTTLKTIMCDISSLLLAEMTTLAKSLQALNTIESPSQSQMNRQGNGTAWQISQAEMASRRNSQYSLPGQNSRSESPAGSGDRSHVRMSMPVFRSTDSNSSTPSARPSTPNNGTQVDLPTTFDQIVASNGIESKSPQKTIPSRLANTEPVRDTSRDRVSVQGFGPGSVSERSRNIGKGRIGIVIGSLYLQAGRWVDALNQLSEAGTISKYNLDHLWHAKALDYILVSMLMLAWTGMDFHVPQICYAVAEKGSQSNPGEPKGPPPSRHVSLQNLTALLPEMLDRILNLYARAANNTGESLPQFPFSESAIRFAKLLADIHLAGGKLDDEVLQLVVVGTPFKKRPNMVPPRLNIRPTRTEIIATLFRAFPTSSSPEYISLVDRTIILSGIASVLGLLGYYRKKAMVMRELVSVLIPGLIQARIKGAAEMGVHPAAGLAALNSVNGNGASALDLGEGDVENGVDSFLGLLSQTYGVVSSVSNPSNLENQDDSNDAAIARIMENATVRSFGGRNLKLDVLRSCINLAEALPDFHGVLRFTADLLRTAGSGVAPGPRSDDASPSMTREEQVRLATNISRTLAAAKTLGVKNLAAEYWDEFLVRGVELEALPIPRTPIPHTKSELPGATTVATARDPFIYNPFLRTPDNSAVDHLLVAGEGAIFRVTLQNPYEFDVEIESIKLESEGTEFESATQKTVIGPYRTQILTVSGTPKSPGQLKITGCIIRIRGCRERRFPIFEEPWSPQSAVKVKTIGVASIFKPKGRPISTDSKNLTNPPVMVAPKAISLGLNVIDRQPIVVVKSSTLSQFAIMVLEGERRTFNITLQNLSPDTPVDLVLFSFKDSTQAPLQSALSNRDASPAELYEYELIFARKQALRWVQKDGEKPFIAPGATSSFEVELLGKPGLTNATVQIDYAYLGISHDEIQDKFHTRQVSLPLTITVNASIELSRMDVLPLTGNVPRTLWSKTDTEEGNEKITPDDYCLLLLDLRNAWPSILSVHLDIGDGGTIEEDVLPGKTSRVMFPVPRIFLDNPSAPIPALDPSRARQFVVSTGRVSADSERTSREAFWYREELLKILHGSWSTKNIPIRKGEIELRGIRLSQRMIEAIKIDDIGIELFIGGSQGSLKHQVFTDTFSELKVKISNRMAEPIQPLLRIQPSIRSQSHNASLDLTKKLVWNGILQQTLPEIKGNDSIKVGIGMTAHCRGEFEISASIEEARLHDPPKQDNGKDGTGRPRANTRTMMDAVLGLKERRIWHSREPCLVVVEDEESSDDDE
ncbi:TRAPP II complex [Tricladium varicosporioides]|nr:TRAPP II complex [Hymenoscyphus varicosporioides]